MVALLPGCRLAPMRVAFAYDSSSERGMMAPECAGIHQLSVRDGREVSSLVVGRRSIEYAGRVLDQAPVEMSGSVLGWLTAGAQEILERHRYPLRAPNNPSLMVTLESLGVNEKFDGRSTYLSSVRLRAEVTLPDGGRCTSVPIAVESSDTGIPNFERNYQERMNHALDRALIGLLASPDVRNALCGRCEGGAAVTQAGTGALTIKVIDAIDRRPVRQVNVVVAGRTGVTDQSGTFHLKNLASGPAAVVAIRAGFRTSE